MLEGGNKQLGDFFSRHGLSPETNLDDVDRYQTNAALFYKKNLSDHVERVEKSGEYKGRDHSRKKNKNASRRKRKQCSSQLKGGKEVTKSSQNEVKV